MNTLRLALLILLVSCGAGSKITLVDNSSGKIVNSQSTQLDRFGECKIGECRFED